MGIVQAGQDAVSWRELVEAALSVTGTSINSLATVVLLLLAAIRLHRSGRSNGDHMPALDCDARMCLCRAIESHVAGVYTVLIA